MKFNGFRTVEANEPAWAKKFKIQVGAAACQGRVKNSVV